MSELGLYRLLAPYFLAGITFPEEADAYLSTLGVTDVTTTYDMSATVTTGTLTWGDAPREHRPASGRGGFVWEDVTVRFRLIVPRDGSPGIDTAAHAGAAPLAALLDTFLPVDQLDAPTEYPGVRFRLELLVDQLHVELGEDWFPARLDAEHRVTRDPSVSGPSRIVLPNVVLAYEQTDDFQSPPRLEIVSWGSGGFAAPSTLTAGQVVRMEPPIAVHRSGRLGFGLGAVVVDFDPDHTPPEILRFFGTDESFTGVYVQSARLYYADEGKDLAVNAAVQDLLISFAGEVSFDASVELLGPETTLSARLRIVDAGRDVPVAPGRRTGSVVTGGKVRATVDARGTVEVVGGTPPVTVSVRADGVELFDAATGVLSLAALSPGVHTLELRVVDAAAGTDQRSYDEDVELTLTAAATAVAGAPADRPPQPGELPAVTTSGATGDATHSISAAGNASGTRERFRVLGLGVPTVTAGGVDVPVVDGFVEVDVPENTAGLVLAANWPAIPGTAQSFELRFTKGKPKASEFATVLPKYLDDTVIDAIYLASHAPGQTQRGTAALRAWLATLGAAATVTVVGRASFESADQQQADQLLSERRRDVALGAIGGAATVGAPSATGHTVAKAAFDATGVRGNPADRVATVTATPTTPAATAGLTVARGQRPVPDPDPPLPVPVPPPAPQPNKPPGVFRRAGIRVKVIRDEPVLLEITGQLDLETELEATLRNPSGAPGSLELTQSPAAVAAPNPNPRDGVVDFRLTIVHDPATSSWSETLAIGAHPDDVDGLLQMTNTDDSVLKNVLGSVLILAPIIGSTAGALDPASAGSHVALGGVIVGAAAVGAAGFVKTEKITLYGGELRFRQFIPPDDPARFTDAGVVFDYGVEFGVDVEALGIRTTKPLKVRYRALGFNLNFPSGAYQPIFDTSKGYELDLSDPGLFSFPTPIDDVLKILGARIGKVNPLTVELDLAMKADLGVVTIDRFTVTIPIDPPGLPTISPSGVKVDIAKVVIGSGHVRIVEPPTPSTGADQPGFGGIEGSFDVTLVPLKLRVAAAFGVRPIEKDGRKATAVFLGLIIDLPAPIPLGQSGIGIYGFSGLFAMHYKRIEHDPNPNDATGPAILWLRDAGGEPARLTHNGVRLWDAELDRWSFGVGLSLGTVDGGFLVNLRGMFVLELPGPRILIFVKILIISPLPDLAPAADLVTGILAVIDLDFARKTLTVGIIVELEIKEIVSVVVPVELFTRLDRLDDWHLYVGTFGAPASALVLNIARGFGYLMIAGHDIVGWPGYGPPLPPLPGIAVAAGIGASVVLGDESIGLYLKVSARADVGVSFSPRLFLAGRIRLEGELRLFIVSIGASGTLDVKAPDPVYLFGEVCGHVDFFFFSVEGCVTVEIGPDPPPPPPPGLVRNVWLQSHAPIITAGQGGDRPIDASLGDAAPAGASAPVVPIDAVPVIQFQTAPTTSSVATFTAPLVTAPGLPTGGWVALGGSRRVTYRLTALRLDGPPPGPGTAKATWRPDPATNPADGRTGIDLALLSNVPLMGARAMERSTDLEAVIDGVWGQVCVPVAPPAAMLWTFCRQRLGPSRTGWDLPGHPWPDPPGTVRTEPVATTLHVGEPATGGDAVDLLLGHTTAGRDRPARVIGPNAGPSGRPAGPAPARCITLLDVIADGDRNPSGAGSNSRIRDFRITVFDGAGRPVKALGIIGVGATRGVDVGFRTEIDLVAPAGEVTLTLVTFAGPSIVTAFAANGSTLNRARTSGDQRVPETVTVRGTSMSRVVIETAQDETLLMRLCVADGERPARPAQTRPVLPTMDAPTPGAKATDLDCRRALQLPERHVPGGKGDVELTAELDAIATKRPDERWVEMATGPVTYARLFLAVDRLLLAGDFVVVEEIDQVGSVLGSTPLSGLSPVSVSGTAGLPTTWTDPNGPWAAEIGPVTTLLADQDLAGLVHLWVTLTPGSDLDRIRVRVTGPANTRPRPAVLLVAVEVLTATEIERHDTAEAIRSGQAETLTGYLDGTSAVPLLAPATPYTLHVDYVPTTEDRDPDGTLITVVHPPVTESFRFTTDSVPPIRLDPYVLASDPGHEEQFVFAGDAVRVVFNDLQVVQLFAVYGRSLRMVLRAADGTATPAHQIGSLDEVPATFTAPLYDLLDAKVAAGQFGCLGAYHHEGHGSFTFPEPLRPSMAYTLDIETDPPPAPTSEPVQPLFRRRFRTGRFHTPDELVREIAATAVRHVVLNAPLTLPTGPTVPDIELEDALVAAGMTAPGAPTRGSQAVLWRPLAGGGHVPHAVLLDASEPLWRSREAPRQETVPNQPDAAFVRIVPGREDALRLEAAADSRVLRFVRSPSGTRTLALLDDAAWPASGATVVIDAVRPASTLHGTPGHRVTVSTIPLAGHAPWEDDDG